MNNKFPISQSFQRLTESPLDETTVFNTLAQTQDYANNNPTSYKGQIIHIKDARSIKEIEDGINAYEESCYIDNNNIIKPICSFTYKPLGLLFNLMNDIVDNKTASAIDKLNIMYKELLGSHNNFDNENIPDYYITPWDPSNYNNLQICLEMTQETLNNVIGQESNGSDVNINVSNSRYTTENIVVNQNGTDRYFKIITFEKFPTRVLFRGGNYIKKVIHMCNTSDITDMGLMFYYCTNLIEVNTNNWDIYKVTDMNQMFYGCELLEELDVSKWNTYRVQDFSKMFYNCKLLKTLDVTYWELYKAVNMSYMFNGCTSLASLDTSRWGDYTNSATLTDISGMFQNCESLTEIDLRCLHVYSVTTVENMFKGCSSLAKLNLSNWSIYDVSRVKYTNVFSECPLLELENIKLTKARSYSQIEYWFRKTKS